MDERMAAARLKASYLFPYFSHGLFALIPIESDKVPTMGVDKKWRMFYNLDFFNQCTIDEVAVVMVHEVLHLLRDHPDRAAISLPEEHTIWNFAGDCEINDDLKDYSLPKGAIYPSSFGFKEGLMAEEYFQLLKNNVEKMKGKTPTIAGGDCGGCATGEGSGNSDGEVKDENGNTVPGVSSLEKEVIKNAVARDIVEGKGRGNCPSGMVRWAEDQLKSTIPWRTLLSGTVRGMIGDTTGMVNYSYSRPSRRQSVFGRIIMPSLRAPLPNVAMLIDTSGSMSAKDLGLAIAEVDGVLRSLATSVTVISNDAEVGAVKRVKSARDVELVGGGGTDLGPGILKASELKPRTDFLIIVSDCDACWGNFVPNFPIIVVRVGGGRSAPPDWIKTVIQVDEK